MTLATLHSISSKSSFSYSTFYFSLTWAQRGKNPILGERSILYHSWQTSLVEQILSAVESLSLLVLCLVTTAALWKHTATFCWLTTFAAIMLAVVFLVVFKTTLSVTSLMFIMAIMMHLSFVGFSLYLIRFQMAPNHKSGGSGLCSERCTSVTNKVSANSGWYRSAI